MRFTVVWSSDAESDLAEMWLSSPDRASIASAADSIDSILGEDADVRGESREESCRVLFVPPLGIDFEVSTEDRMVRVVAVWRY